MARREKYSILSLDSCKIHAVGMKLNLCITCIERIDSQIIINKYVFIFTIQFKCLACFIS